MRMLSSQSTLTEGSVAFDVSAALEDTLIVFGEPVRLVRTGLAVEVFQKDLNLKYQSREVDLSIKYTQTILL
jgi:dUTPase